MDEFKGNSYASKNNSKPKVEKVIKGPVKTGSESTFDKVVKTLFGMTLDEWVSHIVTDVIIPEGKGIVEDIVHNALFPNAPRTHHANTQQVYGRTSYGSYYDQKNNSGPKVSVSEAGSNSLNKPLYFEYREDADSLLWNLRQQIEAGIAVRVSDVYEACGLPQPSYMAAKFGWKDLNRAAVVKAGSKGYTIRFPDYTEL